MAKAVVRLPAWRADHPFETEEELAAQLASLLRDALTPDKTGRRREVEGVTRERRSGSGRAPGERMQRSLEQAEQSLTEAE